MRWLLFFIFFYSLSCPQKKIIRNLISSALQRRAIFFSLSKLLCSIVFNFIFYLITSMRWFHDFSINSSSFLFLFNAAIINGAINYFFTKIKVFNFSLSRCSFLSERCETFSTCSKILFLLFIEENLINF